MSKHRHYNGTDIGKCSINKNNEEIINEVGDSYKNRLTSSSDENIVVVEKVK